MDLRLTRTSISVHLICKGKSDVSFIGVDGDRVWSSSITFHEKSG